MPESFQNFFSSRRNLILLVACVYFFSSFLQYSFNSELKITGFYIGLPHIYSGDEPHFLVTVHSILFDGDLELCNNFRDAFAGGCQAGIMYSGKPEIATPCWGTQKMVSSHSVLNAFMAASFLFPFAAEKCLLEPLAVFFTLIVSLVTIFFSLRIIEHFNFSKKITAILFLALAFASPFWFYSKTFWSEPYLSFFLVVSLYFFLKKRFLAAGFFSAANLLIKPTSLIFSAILFFFAFFEKKKGSSTRLFSGLAFASSLYFLVNFLLYGDAFFFSKSEQAFGGNFFSGIAAVFLAPNFGLLWTFPIFVFSAMGFWYFYKKSPKEALLFFSLFFFYAAFWALPPWILSGTGGYSFRYLAPLIPLLVVPLGFFLQENRSTFLEKLFWLLFAVSLLVNIMAALTPLLIANAPWIALEKIFLRVFG